MNGMKTIMSKTSVIYALQHNKTKKIYIGTTVDLSQRYNEHIKLLRKGIHSSRELQKDFDKYGEDFSLFILDEVGCELISHPLFKNKKILKREIIEADYMKEYNTFKNGYNSQDKTAYRLAYGIKRHTELPLKNGYPDSSPEGEQKGD